MLTKVLRETYKIKIDAKRGIVEDEYGDFQTSLNEAAPMTPAALADPDARDSCSAVAYDGLARRIEAHSKAVIICGKTKAGTPVKLKFEPYTETSDDRDLLLTVTSAESR